VEKERGGLENHVRKSDLDVIDVVNAQSRRVLESESLVSLPTKIAISGCSQIWPSVFQAVHGS
jgi:hypothetical protein